MFTFGAFLLSLAVSVAIALIAYAFMPKPKKTTPDMARDLEMPTADAGRPVPVVFGEGTIKSPNTLWYGEPSTEDIEVSV